jgi:hypothetical protein
MALEGPPRWRRRVREARERPGGDYNPSMERVGRRELLSTWAASVTSLRPGRWERGASVVQTPDGPVLQLERDDLLVLVSGIKPTYGPGDQLALGLILNNQSERRATVQVRTRLLGREDQALAEGEVASVNVEPIDVSTLERSLVLPSELAPGEYTVLVELPPWSFEGRQAGGGKLTARISVVRA